MSESPRDRQPGLASELGPVWAMPPGPREARPTAACEAAVATAQALLLFGFAGALRRSELVAVQVEDTATP